MKIGLKWIIIVIFVMKMSMLMIKNICYIMKEIAPLRGDAPFLCIAGDVN